MDNQNDLFSDSKKFEDTYKKAVKNQDDLLKSRLDSLRSVFEEATKGMDKSSMQYYRALQSLYIKEAELKRESNSKKEELEKYYLDHISGYKRDKYLKDQRDELDSYRESLERQKQIYESFSDSLTEAQKKRFESLKDDIKDTEDKIKDLDDKLRNTTKRTKKEEERQKRRRENLNERDEKISSFKNAFENASSWFSSSGGNTKFGAVFDFFKNGGFKAEMKENLFSIADQLKEESGRIISKMVNDSLNKINQAIDDATSHRTKIMARLQGLSGVGREYNYNALLGKVQNELAISPFVQQKTYLENLDKAVEKGIAYNVEQRAFLASIKDDIATTFDVFDSNLMRIIKLQQADSTKARLGMEAMLTQTLNSAFSDTSYLTDKISDSVTAALIDSEAIMTRQAATEFEYIVQKWMGALYSLGASNKMVEQIAQGLNYIGTGNVQALSSNSSLQTLFAMSASRSGNLDYADLLTGGLTAQKTNDLLKSMVEYLKEIAEDNSNNNVVRSAYGDLYQMSLSDMRAITSLSTQDINSLYNQSMSYNQMNNELSRQLLQIPNRLSVGEMIKNITENFIYNIGSNIAQDAFEYVTWEITDLIEQSTGGLHLPAISVMGNMVDLSSFTVEGIIKTGIVGLSTLGQIGSIISSLGNLGGLNLNSWGYKDTLSRGQIFERGGQFSQTAGSIQSTSGSTYIGSSNSSDIKNSAIASATQEAQDVAEITNKDMETEYTFDDWYNAVLVDHEPIYIASQEEYTTSDIYKAFFVDRMATLIEIDPESTLGIALASLAGTGKKYTFDDWYEETLINHTALHIKSDDGFTTNDLYKSMYVDKTPLPVSLDYSTGLGQALYTLANSMNSSTRITDVNIKKSEASVNVSMTKLDSKLKEEIKNYIKSTYIDLLTEELKESLIGSTKNSGVSIAEACEALVDGKVNVEVKNDGFDDAINNYLRFGV